jgi:predicted membrane protein
VLKNGACRGSVFYCSSPLELCGCLCIAIGKVDSIKSVNLKESGYTALFFFSSFFRTRCFHHSMKLKIWISLFLVLMLAVGCSANEKKKANEPKKEETTVKNESKQNKELTKKVKEEKGVLNGQVYTQDDMAIGTLVLDKK